ncbi:hypothetical protein P43SY_003602 [Pythium insidiosum]|uniref:Carbohydrate-binding protein n=1 Tax=Pythium insidiosum TaxID=114742 RepID=A0AAD5MFD6_PYTIN|nr:hypothetical protein P43SY_003602 [Pythium insidiosum]
MKVRQTWIALSLLLAVIASAPTAVVSQDVGPASGSEFSTNPNGRNPRTNGNPPDVGPASGSSTSTNPNGRPSRPETNGGGGQDPGPASGGSSSSTNPNGRAGVSIAISSLIPGYFVALVGTCDLCAVTIVDPSTVTNFGSLDALVAYDAVGNGNGSAISDQDPNDSLSYSDEDPGLVD